MSFLNPFFLIGLLAVAIPLLIHLINFRRPQKVSFSTLAFFKELQKSTLRGIRVKQYLLLALRTAAVLMLALAVARPFWTAGGSDITASTEPAAIGLLIDDSPSMSRVGSEGPMIEQSKEAAREIVNNARSADRFQIMTTNGSVRTSSFYGKNRALELIEEVEVVNRGSQPAEAVEIFASRLQQEPPAQGSIYFITDGQRHQIEAMDEKLNELTADKPVALQVVRLEGAEQSNLAVSGVELGNQMLSAGSSVALQVEVTNFGEAVASNQYVSAELEGRSAGQHEVTLEPGETRNLVFDLQPEEAGDLAGSIEIEGDDVTFDNLRHFVLSIPRSQNILLIGADQTDDDIDSYLEPVLQAASATQTQLQFTHQSPDEVNPTGIDEFDAVILDGIKEVPEHWFEELRRFVQSGGGVLFFPSGEGVESNYNQFFDLFNGGRFDGINGDYGSFSFVSRLNELEEGHPILDDMFEQGEDEVLNIDLPELFAYFRYQPAAEVGAFTVLETETGDPIFAEQRFGDGVFLISAIGADPGWSNFPVNPLFAPLFYRSVLYASAADYGGLNEHELSESFELQLPGDFESVELELNGTTYRPELQRISSGSRIRDEAADWEPGIAEIEAEGVKVLIAVNQHIMESDFTALTDQDLEKLTDKQLTVGKVIELNELNEISLSREPGSAGFGKEIWDIFVWFALFFLIAETLVSRHYKAETLS